MFIDTRVKIKESITKVGKVGFRINKRKDYSHLCNSLYLVIEIEKTDDFQKKQINFSLM